MFFSSPDEGPTGKWNYTIRADGALESKIVTDSNTNDVEIYVLPLQHAIDFAIAGLNSKFLRSLKARNLVLPKILSTCKMVRSLQTPGPH